MAYESDDQYIKPTPLLERMRVGMGDGFPGPDFRGNIAAEWVLESVLPKIKESIEEVREKPTGYKPDDIADVYEFGEAVVTGLQIALQQIAEELDPYRPDPLT